mgnify:CR=1 FL=1
MRPLRMLLLLVLGAVVALGPGARARAEARGLTLGEAERLALETNPQLRSIDARTRSAEDVARSVRGHMLPALRFQNEYQHYSSPFVAPFQLAPGQQFVLRDQDTNTLVLNASQPLLGLARLIEEYRAQRETASATAAQARAAQAAVRRGLRLGFLRYFEAKALTEIAKQSEDELTEQIVIAEAKLKAGVLTNADILRLQVAKANARQQGVQAQAQADAARAAVLIAVGRTLEDGGDLVEPKELLDASRSEPPKVQAAVTQAAAARPEIQLQQHVISASQHQARSRLYAFLPELSVEGTYVRIDGQAFAPPNAVSVGLKAQWAFWEWGASYYQLRASRLLAVAAREDLAQQQRQIATEVTSELAQSTAARSAVDLAQKTIASAEEAYRVTNVLLKAGSATTTDLLESQAALNQARLNLTRAQYQQAVAHVSLRYSLGDAN